MSRPHLLEDASSGEATESDGEVAAGYTTRKVEQASLAENRCFLRTERALRFSIGAIFPLIIAFGYQSPLSDKKSLLPLSFSYLVGIFYVIFAALLPPQLSSISLIIGGGLSGLLLGCGNATIAFAVTVTAGKTMGLLAFAAGIFLLSSLKTGNYQALTALPQLVAVYGGVIAFVMIVGFGDPGLEVNVPTNFLMTANSIVSKNDELKEVLPQSIWDTATNTYLYVQKICAEGSNHTCKAAGGKLTIPSGDLQGFEMDVSIGPKVTHLAIIPSLQFIHVIWMATGAVGVIRPIMALFFLSVGCLAGSLVLPLPRVRTAYNVTRAELVRVMCGPLRNTFKAAEDVVALARSAHQAGEEAKDLSRNVTDRMSSLLSASKIAAFEPSWPAMGVKLIKTYPELVSAVRRTARYVEASLHGRRDLRPEVEGKVLGSARAVIEASAMLLAAMPHSGDDLTSVPGGSCDKLDEAVSELEGLDKRLEPNEDSWALRHGVIEGALAVAKHTKEIKEMRMSANRSWTGAAMGFCMMLVGFLIPLLLPIYRLFQPIVNLAKGKEKGGGCNMYDLRLQLGLTIGVTALVAPSLYVDWWNEIGISSGVAKMAGMKGKFAVWSVLGFIVSFQATLEGALHKASMRALGTCLGAGCAYLCVLVCGKNVPALMAWLLISYAIAVARGANPINALLGFNLSWGYAAQLFTYTETIIVVEATIGIDTLNVLTSSRLLGQLLGIAVAIVCSFIVQVRARPNTQARIAEAFDLLALGMDELSEAAGAGRGLKAEKNFAAANLFAAADEKLEAAQLVLDDAKVDQLQNSREFIFGPGGTGIERARDALDDCLRLEGLLKQRRSEDELAVLQQEASMTKTAFTSAAERLRGVKTQDIVGHAEAPSTVSEIQWLIRRAGDSAINAGVVKDAGESEGESSNDEDFA